MINAFLFLSLICFLPGCQPIPASVEVKYNSFSQHKNEEASSLQRDFDLPLTNRDVFRGRSRQNSEWHSNGVSQQPDCCYSRSQNLHSLDPRSCPCRIFQDPPYYRGR